MSEYYRLIDVDKNNKELRKQLDYYKRKSTRLQQENKQLKSNWNKLREWLKEYEEGSYGLGSYETGLSDGLGDVIKKMIELEGSGSDE
nr:MAG TPA: GTPase-activating protein [Caudoviricetes sp.]